MADIIPVGVPYVDPIRLQQATGDTEARIVRAEQRLLARAEAARLDPFELIEEPRGIHPLIYALLASVVIWAAILLWWAL